MGKYKNGVVQIASSERLVECAWQGPQGGQMMEAVLHGHNKASGSLRPRIRTVHYSYACVTAP